MQVKQYSPELNPELFFLPRDTGKKRRVYKKTASGVEYYSHSEPIIVYDKPHETYVIDGGVAKRRRSAKGVQELRLYMDHVELWHYDDDNPEEPRCLSRCYLYMQVLDWDANAWVNVRFENVMPKVIDEGERFFYEYKDKGRTWQLEGYWTKGNAKSTYVAKAPGEMVRVRGTLMIFAPDEVVVNYDDFKGVDIVDDRINDYPSRGMQMRTITFGSDGQEDQITVDPYIEVDEQSSYIDVACDGYRLRINSEASASSSDFIEIRDLATGSTEYAKQRAYLYFQSAGPTYPQESADWLVEVVDSNNLRVHVRATGTCGSVGSVEFNLYIYSDRWFQETVFSATASDNFNASSTAPEHYANVGGGIFHDSSLTSPAAYYENSGVESAVSALTAYNSADYMVLTSDELDVQCVLIETDWPSYEQFAYDSDEIPFRPADGVSVSNGDVYTVKSITIIDAAAREVNAKLYTATERLEMGDQWKDLDLSS